MSQFYRQGFVGGDALDLYTIPTVQTCFCLMAKSAARAESLSAFARYLSLLRAMTSYWFNRQSILTTSQFGVRTMSFDTTMRTRMKAIETPTIAMILTGKPATK